MSRARDIIARYPLPRSAVMPLLYVAMRHDGGITDAGMRQVAELTGITPVQVEAAATFYSMYKRHVGTHVVSVCTSISCHLLGGRDVLNAMADETGIPAGETAADGSLTIESVECIGACGGAPAVQVDYEMIEGVTPDKGRELCRWLRTLPPTPSLKEGEKYPDRAVIRGDDLQERFGGRRSFPMGPADPVGAVGPYPAFGPLGTTGGGA
jgi:NADH-quinone oxidoreductase subunit E